MFGKNKTTKISFDQKGSLNVHSMFNTLQGEGPFAGHPALFIRLQGCNLKCWFCDTEFDTGKEWTLDELENYVLKHMPIIAGAGYRPLIVITGGEPLLQADLPAFIDRLINHLKCRVQIETAGTVWQPGLYNLLSPYLTIVVSPKSADLHSQIYTHADYFKYVIKHGCTGHDGLPIVSTQQEGKPTILARPVYKEGQIIYVMPMDEHDTQKNHLNLQAAAESAQKFGYILCVQLHKLAGLE